jgi:hypothetical protein
MSDSDFEEERAPRSRTAVTNCRGRNHGDMDVDAADRVPVVATVVATDVHTETCLQVFYFSQKMFDFMCIHGTSERIAQAYITYTSEGRVAEKERITYQDQESTRLGCSKRSQETRW